MRDLKDTSEERETD